MQQSGDPIRSKLLLVDGHAYVYRAFYAIRNLRSPEGRPTNAIYGFIKMLARMRQLVQPANLAVIWDGGLNEERLKLVPNYKAQRPEMPEDLSSQIGAVQEYLAAAGIVSLQADGVEADDWIATLAVSAAHGGVDVVIASSDKDFYQLVSSEIGQLNPADKTEKIWTAEDVMNKTGVKPGQIVDWLSLMGDAVDNIPGVPGVGPKTASELMSQFGSVEALYANIGEVKSPRLRGALTNAHAMVITNQKMIRLSTAGPAAPRFAELQIGTEDRIRLLELFRQWGFKGMAGELETRAAKQQPLFTA